MGLAAAIGVGAVATAAGSAISSSKASKNARAASAEQTAVSRENNALTERIYDQNAGRLDPSIQRGNAAGALLSDFYGIPQAQGNAGQADWAAYVNGNPDALANWNAVRGTSDGAQFGGNIAAFGQYHYGADGAQRDLTQFTPQAAPSGSSKSAFANYIANSDYGFQQATGNNQVNSGFAGQGTVQSGAAMKALERFRQNLQSGYRNEWAGGVANQQGVGLSAAGALAGVSTNYANTISANNQSAADARSNAALSQQSAFGNALGTFGAGILKGFG